MQDLYVHDFSCEICIAVIAICGLFATDEVVWFVCVSVCVSVCCHVREPRKNGRTDRHAVCRLTRMGPRMH